MTARLLIAKILLALVTHPHAGHVHRQHVRHRLTWHTAIASVYGPADSGGPLACFRHRRTLTDRTVGVANKTLPCHTLLKFRYRGRESYGRVIDRGPFIPGREFDLAPGLRKRLRFPVDVKPLSWAVVR